MSIHDAEIWQTAKAAADAAAHAENARLGPEQARGLDCGFAWVVIKPARGSFVKYLKSQGIGHVRDYGGGYEIWYSKLHSIGTQSISVHWAAAKVFREHGINAHADQRLD